ncbi:hypothetical protein A2999_02370 [Candidatus Wolfebacteria bacterium RIFCSPLOWO2_01_FULL_38_11]|uniref:Uncharacterized protein n=1 Tax=Candidatus Wolfebacteria bacterium RIFCSPLOWO2_01_FULL_38_11 TaxID=1802556 RepID=A0A1F8DVD7_9BACT|nr:MAG: hypothetical protein A2999_02370 [Candidatus Wolfebacteria bacterium RIFCSPLOWO2_01_FULL_38_11]
MRAGAAFLSTPIVNVSVDVSVFLVLCYLFGSYKTAAITAMQKAAENLRVFFRLLASTANFYSVLHLIKKRFGNNRRMISFPYIAAVAEMSVVERIGEYPFNVVIGYFPSALSPFTPSGSYSSVVKKI